MPFSRELLVLRRRTRLDCVCNIMLSVWLVVGAFLAAWCARSSGWTCKLDTLSTTSVTECCLVAVDAVVDGRSFSLTDANNLVGTVPDLSGLSALTYVVSGCVRDWRVLYRPVVV